MRTREQMDADLEADIDAAYQRLVTPGILEHARRVAWNDMARLIRQRSPAQIMRLELERRLLRQTA